MGCRLIADSAAARTLFAPLARERREVAAFAYLDPEWRLLGLRQTRGSDTAIEVSLRLITADALAFDAAAMVMAHNHPGGDPTPSEADRALTRRLARTLDALDIRLLDHLVLAGDQVTSFRAMGLL